MRHTDDCLDTNDDTSVLKGRCVCSPTPTPWEIHPDVPNQIVTDGPDKFLIAELSSVNRSDDYANAAFIVRAVNSHEELLRAAKDAYDALQPFQKETFIGKTIKQVIARAEAK